jgi:hypothetical protein
MSHHILKYLEFKGSKTLSVFYKLILTCIELNLS